MLNPGDLTSQPGTRNGHRLRLVGAFPQHPPRIFRLDVAELRRSPSQRLRRQRAVAAGTGDDLPISQSRPRSPSPSPLCALASSFALRGNSRPPPAAPPSQRRLSKQRVFVVLSSALVSGTVETADIVRFASGFTSISTQIRTFGYCGSRRRSSSARLPMVVDDAAETGVLGPRPRDQLLAVRIAPRARTACRSRN
jgi:hypothetical protein